MEHRAWVSRYREELKGLAILWVVFFHTKLYLPGSLDYAARALGTGGVDLSSCFCWVWGYTVR